MSQQQVRFEQFFAAPCEAVFAYFANHEKLNRIWGGRITRIRDGRDPRDPNGLDSVREVRSRGLVYEETILRYEPHSLIEYAVTKGGPVKNHHGRMEFHPVEGGARLHYTISFEPRIPFTGSLIAGLLCGTFHAGIHRAVKDIAAT